MTQAITGSVGTVKQARTGPMSTGGRWGWYRDHEGNEYRRASKLAKKVETDTYNLDLWQYRQIAEGLAIRDDLVLAIRAMGRPDPVEGWTKADKDKLNSIVKDAKQAAKQRDGARAGTAHHDLTERLDRGEDVEAVVRGLPAKVAETLRAYNFLRRENGWRSVEIERTVVCDELEVAGTFDRVDLIPGLAALLGPGDCQYGCAAAGTGHNGFIESGHADELPVINDVKTEAAPWLNGLHIGPQLAIYSRAKRMWRPTGGMVQLKTKDGKPKTYEDGNPVMVPAGEYVPAPCVRQDVAVVTHLLNGHANPYFINLTEGWEAAQAAYAQMNREARARRALGATGAWFAEVPGIKRPRVAQMLVEQAASRDAMAGHSLPGAAVPVGPPSFGVDGTTVATATPMSDGTAHIAVQRADGMTEWVPADSICNNCAPLVANASSTRVDGSYGDENCRDCGKRVSTPELPIGTQVTVGGIGFTKIDTVQNVIDQGPLDEVDRGAIAFILGAAVDLNGLARAYELYTGSAGRQWGGRVAEAAEARRRQIECPQRQLHTGGTCACGWAEGNAP